MRNSLADTTTKKKEDMEVGASNIEVLLGCTEASTIESETDEVLFETDLWKFALKKLEEIPVPRNPPNDNGNVVDNTNKKQIKKDGLADKKGSSEKMLLKKDGEACSTS